MRNQYINRETDHSFKMHNTIYLNMNMMKQRFLKKIYKINKR